MCTCATKYSGVPLSSIIVRSEGNDDCGTLIGVTICLRASPITIFNDISITNVSANRNPALSLVNIDLWINYAASPQQRHMSDIDMIYHTHGMV
jgi:hypothetical protein